MSTRWKRNFAEGALAAEELENPQEGARIHKRRRDDEVFLTPSPASRVSPTQMKSATFDDVEQETFRFDRMRPTEGKCCIYAKVFSFNESITLLDDLMRNRSNS
jgi:hypothetical protein